MEPSFEALSRSYDFVVVAAGAIVGPDLEAIAAIAPHAVLVAGTLTSAGTAPARERLLDAGFEDVTVVVEGNAADFERDSGPRCRRRLPEGVDRVTVYRQRIAERRRRSNEPLERDLHVAGFRQKIIRGGLEGLYFSGAHVALKPFVAGVGAILTLHHVRPPRPDRFQPNRLLEITPRFLTRVVRYLRRSRLDLVSLDEMHRRLIERDFSRRFVCLTFDDGYRDTLQWAYPILKDAEVPFAVYVPTSFRTGLASCGGLRSKQ